MPKLNTLQWVVFALFILFYGFTVFALTRDYYMRHPPAGACAEEGENPADQPSLADRIRGINDPAILHQLADQLFEASRFAQAATVYERVLELSPDDGDAQNDLGLARYYTGDTPGALEILREASRGHPDQQRIWLTLGYVSARSGDKDGAISALQRAQSLAPDSDIGREAKRLLDSLAEADG